MKHLFRIAVAILCLFLVVGTQRSAFASSADKEATYQLHMEGPQVAQAANGETVSVSGSGTFSGNPKSVVASGTFTSDSAAGSGTWVATQLLDFQPYGCGVVLGFPIPANLCGGKLMLRVLLTDSSGQQFDGILWVFCIIGPNPPNSHDDPTGEGVNLNIVGVNNFNRIVSGGNVYVKTS
jgi:hypothetical protein